MSASRQNRNGRHLRFLLAWSRCQSKLTWRGMLDGHWHCRGVVENGLVRPLDTSIKLPEHARVIIVAADVA